MKNKKLQNFLLIGIMCVFLALVFFLHYSGHKVTPVVIVGGLIMYAIVMIIRKRQSK